MAWSSQDRWNYDRWNYDRADELVQWGKTGGPYCRLLEGGGEGESRYIDGAATTACYVTFVLKNIILLWAQLTPTQNADLPPYQPHVDLTRLPVSPTPCDLGPWTALPDTC
jgi:hypothetical protein